MNGWITEGRGRASAGRTCLFLWIAVAALLTAGSAHADDSALGVTLGSTLPSAVSSVLNDERPEEQKLSPLEVQLGSLELTSLDGNEFEAGRASEKKVVLYFWSIYCRSCVDTLSELEAAKDAFKQADVEVLTLHLFEDRSEVVSAFLERIGFTLQTFLVPKAVRDLFSVKVLPTSLVFDDDGNLLARFDGMADSDGLRLSVLRRTEAETPVDAAAD